MYLDDINLQEEIARVLENIHTVEVEIQKNPTTNPTIRNERRKTLENLKYQLKELRTRLLATSGGGADMLGGNGSSLMDNNAAAQSGTTSGNSVTFQNDNGLGNSSSSVHNNYNNNNHTTQQQQPQQHRHSYHRSESLDDRYSNTLSQYHHSDLPSSEIRSYAPRSGSSTARSSSIGMPTVSQHNNNTNTNTMPSYGTSSSAAHRISSSSPPGTSMASPPSSSATSTAHLLTSPVATNETASSLEALSSALTQRQRKERRFLQEEYERKLDTMDQRHRTEQEILAAKFAEEEEYRAQFEAMRAKLQQSTRGLLDIVHGSSGGQS